MRNTMSYFNVAMFFALPSIMVGLLQAVTCHDTVEGPTDEIVSRIKYYPDFECRDFDDMYYIFAFAGLILWLGILPLAQLIVSSL